MSNSLQRLVTELPEIYQMIYRHEEWNDDASRDCLPRLDVISKAYDTLSAALNRPLRVLDLGCAQGFYSLSLASKGAAVVGVDFLQQNIDVCMALAAENPDYNVSFFKGQIETVIDELEHDQYDMVIGLSVFHHIVHLHGIECVQNWLGKLLERVDVVMLELALKEEPLYWGPSQPENPLTLFEHSAFYHQLAEYPTHLSDIRRPFYILSNRRVIVDDFCKPFSSWSEVPHNKASDAHHGSRRYFFGEDYVCKMFYKHTRNSAFTAQEMQRNENELNNEIEFLTSPLVCFPAAKLLANGRNAWDGWNIVERLPGQLLSIKIHTLNDEDKESVLQQLLAQLVCLEQAGFYHDDVRTWNILLDEKNKVRLIDYGSISRIEKDCNWPENIYLSFFILVKEIITPEFYEIPFSRPMILSPLNFPEPYSNWLKAFCHEPVQSWSFARLQELFNKKTSLPPALSSANANELWIAANEKWLFESQQYSNHQYVVLDNQINQLEPRIEKILEEKITSFEHDFSVKILHEMTQDQEKLQVLIREQLQSQLEEKFGCKNEQYNSSDGRFAGLRENASDLNNNELSPSSGGPCLGNLSHEQLVARVEDAERHIDRLNEENQNLHHRIHDLLHSRSWRLMSPYRYGGLQLKLLRQYGIKQRGKHLIKRIARKSCEAFNRYPVLREKSIHILRKSGQFERARRIYRRIYPLQELDVNAEHQEQKNWFLQDTENRLPPVVNNIFQKLHRK